MAARGLRSNRDGITTRQIQQPTSGPLPDSASPTKNGTVTSVGLTVPARQSVAGSPVTKAGTLAISDGPQNANEAFLGPAAGSPAVPGFRALEVADLPEGAAGSWTPVFSFTTPGDLSVSYSFQFGTYLRIGNWVFLRYTMVFTPTYTTASGDNRVTGFPFSFDNAAYFAQPIFNTITYPAGRPQALIQGLNGTTQARVGSQGDGAPFSTWGTTQFPSGSSRNLQSSLVYLAA